MATRGKAPTKDVAVRFQRLCALLDKVHVPIYLFSATIPGSPLLFVNGAAEVFLGHDPTMINKLKFNDIFHSSERSRVDAIKSVLREQEGENLLEESEMKVLSVGKRPVFVKVSASSVKLGSEKVILLYLADLTEQKKMQGERERALKEFTRISKLADIGQLVAGIAHELNNPLTVVQGYAENIELCLEDETINRDEVRLHLESILKASDRMARIISHMMRMVRQDDFRTLTVDLRDVVEDALQFIRLRFDDFGIEVHSHLDKPLFVRCDPNQIEQILMNIFNNAVHALLKTDGPRWLNIVAESADHGVALRVGNNGPEIPEAVRERVMTPFFTTKPVGEGTGLGLAMSYGIMKNHGGDLTFSSDKEKTEFILHFPPSPLELKSTTEATPGRLILVAEDNKELREHLVSKLRIYNYRVLQAADGNELQTLAGSHPEIECVFVDMVMPSFMPHVGLQNVRKALPNALVYVLTDTLNKQSAEFSFKHDGANGFLAKPIDQEAFADIIRQIEHNGKKDAA